MSDRNEVDDVVLSFLDEDQAWRTSTALFWSHESVPDQGDRLDRDVRRFS